MSHNSTYKVKVADIEALKSACVSFGYEHRENVTVSLYGQNKAKAALAVKLPDWQYEIAIKEDGEIIYDNFGSNSMTSMGTLGKLLQEANKQTILNLASAYAESVMLSENEEEFEIVLEF